MRKGWAREGWAREGWARARTVVAAHPTSLGAAILAFAYLWSYLSAQSLPGNAPGLGWWGWFDQGRTLESARAFGAGDLAAVRHWYPPGYSLLGAPFIGAGFRAHPFALVDGACLLATFAAFGAFAAACGVSRLVAAMLFLVAVAWSPAVFATWTVPWNSSPAAVLTWGALAVAAHWLAGRRRPVLLGALVAAMPAFRPTDTAAVAVCVPWVLAADWRAGQLRARSLAGLAGGSALLAAPQLALHLAIYGPHPSEYMQHSRTLGFTPYDLGWKAYVLLADPYPWFADGTGLLRRLPWMALGLAGLLPALRHGRAAGLLAAALVVHLLLYLSYLDLLPTGLWRFNNVHYWKWTVPGYALLAWLLVRDLARWPLARLPARPRYAAAGSLLAVAVLSCLRIEPRPAGPDEPAKMLEYHGPAPGFAASYEGDLVLHDALGSLASVSGMRAVPVPGGMRVLALARPFTGPVTFDRADGLPGGLPEGLPEGLLDHPPDRWAGHVVLGRPCWLPGSGCGPRPVNRLLPP